MGMKPSGPPPGRPFPRPGRACPARGPAAGPRAARDLPRGPPRWLAARARRSSASGPPGFHARRSRVSRLIDAELAASRQGDLREETVTLVLDRIAVDVVRLH